MKKNDYLSILIGCFGSYPQYSLRAVRSALGEFKVHVGCNECGDETLEPLRAMYDSGAITTLIQSRVNLNKDPLMRLLIDCANTEYVLWMDDDSHLLPGWQEALVSFLNQHSPLDVAGHVFYCERSEEYLNFLKERPWWRGIHVFPSEDWRNRVWFATGGLFIARTAFLQQHKFPDRGMVKKADDLLLGDLVGQQGGKLVDISGHRLSQLVRISDGDRRGTGEGTDGWKFGVH